MILSKESHQRVNFLQKLKEFDAWEEFSNQVIIDPPCGLTYAVEFKDKLCPYSRCKNCFECLQDEDDLQYIEILKTSERFGQS